MNNNPRYIAKLTAAKDSERAGKLITAANLLTEAERLTSDSDELQHLRVWRARLMEQAAKTKGGEHGTT